MPARSGCRFPGLVIYQRSIYNDDMKRRALQEPAFLILTSLAAGPQHGYGIMTDVAEISDGRVRIGAGTLYAALDRLSTDHLVEPDREEIVAGRLRRHYRLTPDGATVLAAEAGRLRANAAAATRRLRQAGQAAGGPA